MEQEPITPQKSPNDKRDYQVLTLPNQLKLLFISDPEITKSACSISVGVGSIFDYDKSLGLAHFLQHMLFMGSTKFPSHNEYSSFISTNSGMDNAYTSDSETNYYFEIKNSAFVEAVERITDFFVGALLKAECVEKQRQAVHEEYVLWTNDDNCRKWEIMRKMANPPYSRFSIGNNETLNHPQIRDDLVNFYEKYYSSNIINAVLYSNFSITEMKQKCLKFFEQIPNKNVTLPHVSLHFDKEQTGKLIKMQSIKDQSIMEFFWVVEYLRPFYKNQITSYLTQLLGHEGQNSLLSILKQKQLANELSSYHHHLKTQTLVCIEVKLTEEGKQSYEDVYNIIMDYVSSLQVSEQLFEQINQKNQIKFEFKEKSRVPQYVCTLSSNMHHIPPQEILNYSTLCEEFNPEFMNKIIRQINPFNVIIVFSQHEEIQGSITQKYLGGKYNVLELPSRKKILGKIGQIPANKYIPIDKTIYPSANPSCEPKKLKSNIYYINDTSFRVCKCGINLNICNTSKKQSFFELYSEYLPLLFKQISYPAEILDLELQYDLDSGLISIKLFGFNDTASKLIKQLANRFQEIHSSERSQQLFEMARQKLLETLQNFYVNDIDDIAEDTLSILLIKNQCSVQETIDRLQKLQFNDFKNEMKEFWDGSILEWIVVGNITEEQTLQITSEFEAKVKNNKQISNAIIPIPCLVIPSELRHQVILNAEDITLSACIVYYQAGEYEESLFYKLKLLQNHISEPFFNELRTQRQLAYYLSSSVVNIRGVLGLKFFLVSSTIDPEQISQEIKAFVTQFLNNLSENMKGDILGTIKQSVLTKITSPHENMEKLFEFIKKQIQQGTNCFNRKDKEHAKNYLDQITLQDLQSVWNAIQTRSLDVMVVSQTHLEAYQKKKKATSSYEEIKGMQSYKKDIFLQRFSK